MSERRAHGGRLRIAGLVPAYRAADTVAEVVRAFAPLLETILVVDDGSGDGTDAAAVAAGAQVVHHEANRGKGAALVTGFGTLAGQGSTHALTIDADGQHLPSEVPTLLAAVTAHPEAIVVGERQKGGHAIHWANRLGNRIADALLTRIAGGRLPDTQSGFRVYPIGATLALGARGARYDFETEILLRAARAGMPVLGVPVDVHYPAVDERVSHYRPVVDSARIVRTVLRVLADRR